MEILEEIWAGLVRMFVEWSLNSLKTFLTWWMSDSAYNVQMTGEEGGVLYSLREHTNWLTAIMAFAGFLVAAFRIAIQRKGEPFRAALGQFVELAVIVTTVATAVNLATIAGDRYSAWILTDLMPEGDGWIDKWESGLELLGNDKDATGFILAAFAFAAAISTVIQFGLMLFRNGALIILVGIIPAVAASRFTTYGDAAYRRCLHWLISFVLFKPVAATIYAGALALMNSEYEADRLFGLALVAGAVFALPATLRAVMPAVAENNSFFGIRQVGHFAFGGTATNVGKGVGIWTGLTGIGGGKSPPKPSGPSGGAAAGGPPSGPRLLWGPTGGGSGGGSSDGSSGASGGGSSGASGGGSTGGSGGASTGASTGASGGAASGAASGAAGSGGAPGGGTPSGGSSGGSSGGASASGSGGGSSSSGSSGGSGPSGSSGTASNPGPSVPTYQVPPPDLSSIGGTRSGGMPPGPSEPSGSTGGPSGSSGAARGGPSGSSG